MAPPAGKTISLEEVKKHTKEEDCWIIVHGKVYDVTSFLDEHPGGFDIIISNTGKDATEDFEEIGHSNAAHELLAKYIIGEYEGGDTAVVNRASIHAVQASKAQGSGMHPALKALQILGPILVILAAIFLPGLLKRES